MYPTLKCGYVRWDASLLQLLGTDTIAMVTDPAGNQCECLKSFPSGAGDKPLLAHGASARD